MKAKLLIMIAFYGFMSFCSGQEKPSWNNWRWLIGDWEGEGSGKPGQGSGTFSFYFDLDRNVIVRKSHSEYPATAGKPKIIHDDLMIIYADGSGNQDEAVYFDNEGHKISYTVSYKESSIVLTSNRLKDMPVYRLVYTLLGNETINTRFEMSRDGVKFMPYVEGKSIRAVSRSNQPVNQNYDSTLAAKLGADQYGMKMYVMVILKTGTNNVQNKAKRDSLFAGHQNNIRKLAGMRKLIVAGPFSENDKSYRGIFILDARTFEEAKVLLDADPTIKENIFEPEFYHWYGSAALPEYLPASDKIRKVNP